MRVDPDNLNPDLVFILVNAIYFKAQWWSRFDKNQTDKKPFYTSSGSVHVDMMQQTNRFLYAENRKLGLQVLDLQYRDTKASMLILLPAEGRLAALEEWLSVEALTKIQQRLTRVEVNLELPRFEMDLGRSLVKDLKALGVNAMYSDSADFSNLTDHPMGIYISKVIHRARVRVDEEGTEAAAYTAIHGELLSGPPEHIPFIVNRPFIFLIHDRRTGAILFIGRVVNPNQKGVGTE